MRLVYLKRKQYMSRRQRVPEHKINLVTTDAWLGYNARYASCSSSNPSHPILSILYNVTFTVQEQRLQNQNSCLRNVPLRVNRTKDIFCVCCCWSKPDLCEDPHRNLPPHLGDKTLRYLAILKYGELNQGTLSNFITKHHNHKTLLPVLFSCDT